jgi:hypothetical protein
MVPDHKILSDSQKIENHVYDIDKKSKKENEAEYSGADKG